METRNNTGTKNLIVLSAKQDEPLNVLAKRMVEFLERRVANNLLLTNIAYTLQVGREAMEERLALVVSSVDEMQQKLTQYVQGITDIEACYRGNVNTNTTSSLLLEGREGKEFINIIIQDRRLSKLAQLWVSGINIDWQLLYPNSQPQRISLPTYPFMRERYWIPIEPLKPSHYGKQKTHLLHPLIDEVNFERSLTNQGVVFQKTFTEADLIVNDHIVAQQRILPGVGYLEMAYAAATTVKKDCQFQLARVFWLQPLVIEKSKTVQILIREESKQLSYQIQSDDGTRLITHAKGELKIAQKTASEQRLAIEKIKARCAFLMDKTTLYHHFDGTGVNYGTYFQGLHELWGGSEEALGRLCLPADFEQELQQYTLHPSLMDSALQAIAGIQMNTQSSVPKALLPFAVETVEILQPLPVRGYAYVKKSGPQRFHVAITNDSGLVCLKFHDIALRALSDPLEHLFYAPRWISHALLPKSDTAATLPNHQTVLIIYPTESAGLEQAFAEYHFNDDIFKIQLGTVNKQYSEHHFEIKTTEPLALEQCFESLAPHVIYYLGGIQPQPIDCDDLAALEQSQQRGVLSLFRLIKALIHRGLTQQSRQLYVVTNDVQRINSQVAAKPYAASLYGLAKSISKEYSQLAIRCIDISLNTDSASKLNNLVKVIVAEPDSKGEEIVLRNDFRYVRVLEAVRLAAIEQSSFKHQGVYLILGGAGGIGLAFCRYLAKTFQARVVLLGRRELDTTLQNKITQIESESQGGKVHYIQADAQDVASMQKAVDLSKSHFGAINGVIHSAIVLRDKTFYNMDEETFRTALAPKVQGSVILHKVLRNEPLDFMMFFSSMQSFSSNAGQSNYAAGCTFKDAFAHYLNQSQSYSIKIINWGYWGSVGIVADEAYNQRLAMQGIQSIQPQEGMEAIERILAYPVTQIIPLKADAKVIEAIGIDRQHYREIYPEKTPSIFKETMAQIQLPSLETKDLPQMMQSATELNQFSQSLLLRTFQQMGVFQRSGEQYDKEQLLKQLTIIPDYARLYEALLDILSRADFIQIQDSVITTHKVLDNPDLRHRLEMLDDNKQYVVNNFPDIAPHIQLLWACVTAYPDVLTGQQSATAVMFPGGSKSLVENLYQGNLVTDYYNQLIAMVVKVFVRQRLQSEPNTPISILEVGAGTGGTSQFVLEQLKEYAQQVHYFYTDISLSFTQHGEKIYGTNYPFAEFTVLNIEQSPEQQGFVPNSIDLIFGSNVFHATQQISHTINQAKRLLKTHGLLLINEVIQRQDFSTLTFGLTEGWWLFEDEDVRLPYSPVLGTQQWQNVLESNGFSPVQWMSPPNVAIEDVQQGVIVGESDGNVIVEIAHQETSDPTPVITPSEERITENEQPSVTENTTTPVSSNTSTPIPNLAEKTLDYVKGIFAAVLKIKTNQLDPKATFERYGVDSLVVLALNKEFEKELGQLPATLLFENITMEQLTAHFLSEYQPRLTEMFQGEVETLETEELFHSTATTSDKNLARSKEQPISTAVKHSGDQTHKSSVSVDKRRERVEILEQPQPLASNQRIIFEQDIAIIGVNGRYPQSDTLEEYWQNLKHGNNCITEIPKERWDWQQYYDAKAQPYKSYSKWGGFIRDVNKFDPLFFNISPLEAEGVDPQERLFLETAWATFEDAGYTQESFAKVDYQIGAFVGVMNCNYEWLGAQANTQGIPTGAHSAYWSIANRLSYTLNLQGPSMAIDTACSSSLTAIHLACESLKRGECQLAIAGGVNLILHPVHYLRLCQATMLAKDEKCKSFGAGADGFIDGEGVGAVLLKPLEHAIAEGDQIYAVIKSSSINAGGKTSGYSVPNPNAQANLIKAALQKAKINPRTISYVEAHGTGTSLGDPIEIAGLKKAYQLQTQDTQYCSIGSVKSNIGHLESAAGVAGLTKVLLQMKHQQLVPSLHTETLNPKINFEQSPFYVQHELAEWKQPVIQENGIERIYPRRAAMSSFGAGGANAHLILEEYEAGIRSMGTRKVGIATQQMETRVIVVLSAKDEDRLQDYAKKLNDFIECQDKSWTPLLSLVDVAYTLQIGREAMGERLAIVVSTLDELQEKLSQYVQGQHDIEACYRGNVKNSDQPALLIEGEEGQYFVKRLIDSQKLDQLAKLWVSGINLDWHLLYSEQQPQRISLPTYPFAREVHWISSVVDTTLQEKYSPALPENEKQVLYYQPVWQKAFIDAKSLNALPSGTVLLFDNHESRCHDLTKRLNHNNIQIILVKAGTGFSVLNNGTYTIDPDQPSDYVQLLTMLKNQQQLPNTLLHLWSISENEATKNIENLGVYAIFHLIKAFYNVGENTLTRALFIFNSTNPFSEAVAGYGKSLALLLPKLSFSTIQLDNVLAQDNNRLLDSILQELSLSKQSSVEIRYEDEKRYLKQMQLLPLNENVMPPLKKQGVYLITGGLGGLGLRFAHYLAEQYQVKLVLLGRSPLNATKQASLAELEQLGATVLYFQADVANKIAMTSVIYKVKVQFGQLNGIIHAAGVGSEKAIIQKEIAEVELTLKPKIQGTITLDEVTATEPLDFFVLFSSTSSILGDFGQCDYAIGNRFLDSYAQWRENLRLNQHRFGQTISINWPLWREGEMHLGDEGELLYLKSSGMDYLETAEGLKAFEAILGHQYSQVVVMVGTPQRIAQIVKNSPLSSPSQREENNQKTPLNSSNLGSERQKTGKSIERLLEIDVQKIAAGLLNLNPQRLDINDNLGVFGFDSVSLKTLADKLGETFQIEISPAVFFAHSNVKSLSAYLLKEFKARVEQFYDFGEESSLLPETTYQSEHSHTAHQHLLSEVAVAQGKHSQTLPANEKEGLIAIIGASGIFPGSKDLSEFWTHLQAEHDLITEVPKERWDWRDFYGDPAVDKTKSLSKWGGFIQEVDKFDPRFFKLSPREVEVMDPQHRLFVETVWKTIEDAGYPASAFSGKAVGVFAGIQFNDFQHLLANYGGDFHEYISTGTGHAMLANRVSFLLNLRGPSESIDTACSSSLVAIHQAINSIQRGESELAIAGGVSLMLSPTTMISASQLGVLSPEGRCKTFDKSADGYVKGEGIGAILLKPLDKAIADNDNIYGVIKGSAVNHGGKAASLTAPNSEAQADLLVKVYEDAKIEPDTITFLELHGTGTELGDPVEVEGLKQAFARLANNRPIPHHYCGLGTVKTNIGHLEPAAGIAGLLKVLLAMRHQTLPATLHLKTLNPYIDLTDTPFYIVDKTQPWEKLTDALGQKIPRRAGVSSFGFGGANAHIVIEEYERSKSQAPLYQNGELNSGDFHAHQLIVLSAKNEERLKAYAQEMIDFLETESTALKTDEIGLRQEVHQDLCQIASDILNIDVQDIAEEESLNALGFDLMTLTELANRLNDKYPLEITPTLFSEYATLNAIAQYIQANSTTEHFDKHSLVNFAYTLQVGRETMEHRLALIVVNLDEVKIKLTQYVNGQTEIDSFYQGYVNLKTLQFEDEERDALILTLLKARKLDELAKQWLIDAEIDWQLLYQDYYQPKRISLPTYPFARERYWIPEDNSMVTNPLQSQPKPDSSTINEQSTLTDDDALLKALRQLAAGETSANEVKQLKF
jgi:polyketide synthase PksM